MSNLAILTEVASKTNVAWSLLVDAVARAEGLSVWGHRFVGDRVVSQQQRGRSSILSKAILLFSTTDSRRFAVPLAVSVLSGGPRSVTYAVSAVEVAVVPMDPVSMSPIGSSGLWDSLQSSRSAPRSGPLGNAVVVVAVTAGVIAAGRLAVEPGRPATPLQRKPAESWS